MPKVSEMRESRFLKRSDAGRGILLTITGAQRYNVAKEGADEELKWCLEFRETDKPLVLNSTNIGVLEGSLGDDTDKWIGRQIVVWDDPTIQFKGKITGGLRVRMPRAPTTPAAAPAAQAPTPPAAPAPAPDADDLPF